MTDRFNRRSGPLVPVLLVLPILAVTQPADEGPAREEAPNPVTGVDTTRNEPDPCADAPALEPGESVHTVLEEGAVDCYAVELRAGEYLKLTVNGIGRSAAAVFWLPGHGTREDIDYRIGYSRGEVRGNSQVLTRDDSGAEIAKAPFTSSSSNETVATVDRKGHRPKARVRRDHRPGPGRVWHGDGARVQGEFRVRSRERDPQLRADVRRHRLLLGLGRRRATGTGSGVGQQPSGPRIRKLTFNSAVGSRRQHRLSPLRRTFWVEKAGRSGRGAMPPVLHMRVRPGRRCWTASCSSGRRGRPKSCPAT